MTHNLCAGQALNGMRMRRTALNYISLKYEPASEPLHISVNLLVAPTNDTSGAGPERDSLWNSDAMVVWVNDS